MAKLVDSRLEANHHNPDGSTVTLYFDGKPTDDEVLQACVSLRGKLALSIDVKDEFYAWDEVPTVVSEAANLVCRLTQQDEK